MIHLDENTGRRSILGGCCSIWTYFLITIIVGLLAKGLLMSENPYISTVSVVDDGEDTIHMG